MTIAAAFKLNACMRCGGVRVLHDDTHGAYVSCMTCSRVTYPAECETWNEKAARLRTWMQDRPEYAELFTPDDPRFSPENVRVAMAMFRASATLAEIENETGMRAKNLYKRAKAEDRAAREQSKVRRVRMRREKAVRIAYMRDVEGLSTSVIKDALRLGRSEYYVMVSLGRKIRTESESAFTVRA